MAYQFWVVRYFLAAVLTIVCSLGHADSNTGVQENIASIILSPGFSRLEPGNKIFAYRDLQEKLTVHDIMQLPASAFLRLHEGTPNSGLDNKGTFWFKMDLKATESMTAYSEIAFPSLREVNFYAVRNNKLIAEYHTGFKYPFSTRPLKTNNFVFPVQLAANQLTTVYISIRADGPVVVPITFWEKDSLNTNLLHSHSVMAMYLGLIIALALYNLVLYFSIKDSAYLYYTLHLVFICWFQSSMMGYTAMYIWQDYENPLRYLEPPLIATTAFAVVFQFTRKFLNIKRISTDLDKYLSALSWVALAMIPLILLGPLKLVIQLMFIGFVVCVLSLIYSAFYAFKRKARSARYFLIGWGILISGAVVQQQFYQSLLPYNFFTVQSILFASGIEAILMSIALADRINVMRQEKDKAHKQALDAAEQSNNIKDQFLATISHELRTPMNGVIGALELINTRDLDPENRNALNVARLSSKRMLTLINGMLNYTEAQMENALINKRPFRLPHDVQDLIDHLHQACASRHLQVFVKAHFDQSEHFYGDIEKIRTLILHLTENALKFTTKGCISIEFSLDIPTDDNDQHCNLIINIEDTGVGISRDKQEEIFQVFRQLDGDYNRRQGGMGIGLALVKKMVSILGGDIRLESTPGEGTQFELSIPVDRFGENRENEKPTNLAYIHQNHEPFILIAEDNEVNQKILAALCSKLGYRSIVAVNGEAAVTIAKQVEPALIFMDCQMPIMDGFEATKKIRLLNQRMHQIPIIAVTANASSKDQKYCFEVGMNDHITKPITLNSISTCLLRWLPEQQHQEALLKHSQNGVQ